MASELWRSEAEGKAAPGLAPSEALRETVLHCCLASAGRPAFVCVCLFLLLKHIHEVLALPQSSLCLCSQSVCPCVFLLYRDARHSVLGSCSPHLTQPPLQRLHFHARLNSEVPRARSSAHELT